MATSFMADQHTIYQTDLRPADCDCERLIFPHTVFMLGQAVAEQDIEYCPCLGREALEAKQLKWMISSASYFFTGLRPVKGSQVLSETWSPGIKGINFLRSHLIFAEQRNAAQLVAHGSSRWFLVDRDSRRPIRPYDVVDQADYKTYMIPEPDLDFRPLRIKPSSSPVLFQEDFAIAYSLLDDNYHLNNVNYISLSLDCLWSYLASQNLSLLNYQVREIHCNYLAEVRAGQTLSLSLRRAEDYQTATPTCVFQGQSVCLTPRRATQAWDLLGEQRVEETLEPAFRALLVLEEKS